ncbi:glycoside hydrolase family 3 protein, partial [Streptomyces sp. NPDC003832]
MTTVDDLARLTAGADMHSTHSGAALGVRALRLVDGPMGVTGGRLDERDIALLTPCATALAATWDDALVREVGGLLGEEAAEHGVDILLGPNLNLTRSPLSGRSFEHFGEDPRLAGALGAAWIEGLQSKGVAACAKHLVCNDSETDRHRLDVRVDGQTLHEVYLAPFEAAARAGVWTMMAAYNKVGGVHCAEHPGLLDEVLRRTWRWDGVVMSDWFGTHSTTASLTAGLDLEMPGPARQLGARAADAVRAGEATRERLEVTAARLAELSRRTAVKADPRRAPRAARELLRRAAADAFVLLKNDRSLLPLPPLTDGGTLAVVGPGAADPVLQGGTFARVSLDPRVRTPLEALRAEAGAGLIRHEQGTEARDRVPPLAPLSPVAADDPTQPGFTVTYHRLAADGTPSAPLFRDVRNTHLVVWFTELPGIGALDELPSEESALVRASCLLTPARTGTYDFRIAGTGSVTLRVDGESVGTGGSRALPADVMGALLRGEVTRVPVELTAGRQVRIEVEMRLGGGRRAHGLSFGGRAPVPDGLLDRAVRAARESDTAVVFAGVTQDSSLESQDRTSLALPADQEELIRRVCEANPRTVVVVNAPYAVDMPWADKAAAVLLTWFAGQEYGPAVADVLLGRSEPGGRLPVTLALRDADHGALSTAPDGDGRLAYTEGLLTGYRHFDRHGIRPRHAFGHGLGYADIRWRSARLSPGTTGDTATVSATLRCHGDRAGKEVVQVYVAPLDPGRETPAGRPEQQLAGFATARLAPGEERCVEVGLDPRAFSEWSERGWAVREGCWEIRIARSSRDVFQRFAVYVDTCCTSCTTGGSRASTTGSNG